MANLAKRKNPLSHICHHLWWRDWIGIDTVNGVNAADGCHCFCGSDDCSFCRGLVPAVGALDLKNEIVLFYIFYLQP
jgi:hypothetical protein